MIYLFGIRPTDNNIHLGHISILKMMIEDIINKRKNDKNIDIKILIADAHAFTTGSDETKKERYNKLNENISSLINQIDNTFKYFLTVKNGFNILDDLIFGKGDKKISITYYNQLPCTVNKKTILNKDLFPLYIKIQNIMGLSEISSIPSIKEYKNNMDKDEYLSSGFYNYPLLQAADILSLKADVVYVGKDQLPNMKILKKVINKLEYVYGEKYFYPEIVVLDEVIPGYDGRKMSKSYNNVISINEDEITIKNKLRLYTTDGHNKGENGDTSKCAFFKFTKLLLNNDLVNKQKNYCEKEKGLCKICKEKFGGEIIYLINSINKKNEE